MIEWILLWSRSDEFFKNLSSTGGECDNLIQRDEHSKKSPQNANT